jgi:hypothetical protein
MATATGGPKSKARPSNGAGWSKKSPYMVAALQQIAQNTYRRVNGAPVVVN